MFILARTSTAALRTTSVNSSLVPKGILLNKSKRAAQVGRQNSMELRDGILVPAS